MSIRGTFTSALTVFVTLLLGYSLSLAAEAEKSSSQDPPSVDEKAETQTDKTSATARTSTSTQAGRETERIGAVQVALKRLYAIPRLGVAKSAQDDDNAGDQTEPTYPAGISAADTDRLGAIHDKAIRNSVSSVPIGGQTLPHRLGMQHADSMRASIDRPPFVADGTTDTQPAEFAPGIGQPVAYTPYGYYYRRRGRLNDDERRWSNYVYYNGRPSRYGYGIYDRFGDGGGGDVYRFGFNRGYNAGRFDKVATERQEAVLASAQGHLEKGLKYLREGNYRRAADAFKLAADTNHGDPAARIYAAHALFATGRYRDAVPYLRRAFELQPKIAFLDFDIRDDYGQRDDFDRQLADLQRALKHFPSSQERLIVLGYVLYYTDQRDKAYEPLAKACKKDPNDTLIKRLLDNCQPPDVVLDEKKTDTD